jgi:putative membrane protein
MSVRRLMATAGGLIIAMTAVPRVQLHGQLDALRQDSRFIFDAASSNLLEVRLGQLAQSKATNAAVKQFGQQMVTDHTNLQNQLTATVSKSGTRFQPGMNDEDEKEFERLEDISGAEFDREYMTAMIQHHQEDVAAFQSQGQSARSAEARQIATSGLPVLQQHLNMAIQVGRQIGVNTGVAVNPTTPTPPVATPQPAPNTGTPPVATPQPVPGAQSDVSADLPFIRQAGSSNLVEIRLGQAAQNKGSNAAVKQFAQRMVTDHTNLQNQLTAAASTGGQTYTPSIDPSDQWQVTRIERLSGADFDRAYMSYMIRAHQNNVSQFQIQSQSARSNQIRTLATNSLPILQQHLSLAVQVGNQVGADTTTTVAGPNQPGDGGNRGDVPAPAEFVQDVHADNMMMIQLGERAQERARNREVREFAEREARDHERLQNQWTSMASRHGLPSRPGMGPRHREKVELLEDARGNNFDRVYMTLMIQQHSDEVSYWRKEGRASRSAQVRELVNRGLPTLERHFEQAKEIGRRIGVNPEAALRNRTDVSRAKKNNKNRN